MGEAPEKYYRVKAITEIGAVACPTTAIEVAEPDPGSFLRAERLAVLFSSPPVPRPITARTAK